MREPPFKTKHFLAGIGMFFVGAYLVYTYPLKGILLDKQFLDDGQMDSLIPAKLGLLLLGLGGVLAVCALLGKIEDEKDQGEE